MYLIEIQLNVWLETEEAIWYANLTEAAIKDYQWQFAYLPPQELREYMRENFQVAFFRKDKKDPRKLHEFFSNCFGLNVDRIMEVKHVT